ncbi:MAG: bifunctional diaminohydroxyphosphoribosylaminopyrimidine deaminase/5-amino-6-(5-phosphoribosylamino)uracil reductase RibD [Candidatus Omnitrophica bacterium]|nr:bifunctional diaminohydroxyphosphoribosylaminopyrimidine deaminase/5-amino-6-(5-phosphoribosylamino)uracil reductase RibD [Candidatus Omnitrophota bacterium]
MNDIDFMKMAKQLALKGKTTTSPNPMVGAVIVKKNKVVAHGFHHHRGGSHAEVVALKKATSNLRGAKLYVTLEPCFHYGRTPPCVDAILKSGIKNIIVGMTDPNPLTNGKSIAKLRKAGVKVKVGVLRDELMKMNESFVKYIVKKTPFIVAKTAQTLDGKIATRAGESKWITSPAARTYAHNLRNEFDAILVGINTILKDNPSLNAPLKPLKKIVLDSSLRIPLNAKIFMNTKAQDCFIATTKKANKKKVSVLEKRGVNVVICPVKKEQVDIKWLLKKLARQEIARILIEGGGQVIGSALKEKLVDKMLIFIAPKILGDQGAHNSIDGLNVLRLVQAVGLRDMHVRQIGEDSLFEGYIK